MIISYKLGVAENVFLCYDTHRITKLRLYLREPVQNGG